MSLNSHRCDLFNKYQITEMRVGRPEKYNRVSCHKKYRLRRLILIEKLSVKEAAKRLNINYSTAKTIMFFFRKSPPHSLSLNSLQKDDFNSTKVSASYKVIKKPKKIEIVCMVEGEVNPGSKNHNQTNISKEVKLQEHFQL